MKILFICGSLEPGKDGVGDYTRRLAAALIRNNRQAAIIAINDQHLTGNSQQDKQADNDICIPVLRLSSKLSWVKRIEAAKNFIDSCKPAWISLQYVPFGFHLKGLPFSLGKRLKKADGKSRWHIMFHELSVNKDESLKFKAWAFLQVRIIQALMKALQPAFISTNTGIYRHRLEKMGYTTGLLPLFSNIPFSKGIYRQPFDSKIPAYILEHRDDYLIGTLFGSFDFKSWDMRSLLDKFSYGFSEKRIVLVSIGNMSSGSSYWEVLKYDYPQVLFLRLGRQDADFISYWLSEYTDFGILTTLPELASKSGSFMALKEHGIPVVCKESTAELEQYNIPLDEGLTRVAPGRKFCIPPGYAPAFLLDEVVKQYEKELSTVEGQ